MWKPISIKEVKNHVVHTFMIHSPLLVHKIWKPSSFYKKTNSEVNLIHRSRSVHNMEQQQESFKYLSSYLSLVVVWTSNNGVVFPDIEAKFIFPDMSLPELIWPHYLRSIERITNGSGALLLQAVTWACQIN